MKKLRWGILSTGNIARQFCTGVNRSHRCELASVASRSIDSARSFAIQFGIPAAHGDYAALLSDRAIDAVYVGLPNHMHHEWTLRCLAAGKHVLCEKPLASNAAQAREMFDAAATAGRLLVEAFMYRSHPLTHAVVEAVRSGKIGQLRLVRTSFCFAVKNTQNNIRFSTEMAGGGLMDVGCYCISLSRLLAGEEPNRMAASAHLHPSGVDDLAAATLGFPGGVLASFTCGMIAHADNTAHICGSDGFIEVPVPWKPPATSTFTISRGIPPRMDQPPSPAAPGAPAPPPRVTITIQTAGELYGLEADDFAAAVLDGKMPAVSAADSLGNMHVLDQLRRQVGVPV
jgi:xylose dehydrogenase (NAD/NADP)